MRTVRYKSLSHENATRDQREEFLKEIRVNRPENSVLINTCNRVELYYSVDSDDCDCSHFNAVAVHLSQVISGIRSHFVGESDIKFQVKNAYLDALRDGYCDKELNLLFQNGMRIAKKVRSTTDIAKGAVSHSTAAVKIVDEFCEDLSGKKIVIIGAHRMNRNIIKHLQKKGADTILMSNRTYSKAVDIAEELDCRALKLDEFKEEVIDADVIITATSCPHALLDKHDVMMCRHKLLIVDLGFPQDVHTNVDEIEHITRYDLKRIESLMHSNAENRVESILIGKKIIQNEVDAFICDHQEKARLYDTV